MKLNKKNIIIFFVLSIFVLISEYEILSLKEINLSAKRVLYLDENAFKMFHKQYDTQKDTNPYWGISKRVENSKYTTNDNNNTSEHKVIKQGNVLCISNSCYRLLSIHYESNEAIVTLYNKDFKEKVRSYSTETLLQDGISIEVINIHTILFREQNSSREWKFKIFDVNTSSYKPKELEI